MSLKTTYNLPTEMKTVYELGVALIQPTPTPQYTIIQDELAAAAAAGKTEFTVNITHNAINANLELKGTYWDSYNAGLIAALSAEDVYDYEVKVELNTTIAGSATLDLNFTF